MKGKYKIVQLNDGSISFADTLTGELIELDAETIKYVTIQTKEQYDYQEEHLEKFKKKRAYFHPFSYYGNLGKKSLSKIRNCNLKVTEFSVMLLLFEKCSYEKNFVKESKGKFADKKYISEQLKLSYVSVNNALKKLENEEIIKTVKKKSGKAIVVNPYIFFIGNTVSEETHELFKTTKWKEEIK